VIEIATSVETRAAIRDVVVTLGSAFDDEDWDALRNCLSNRFQHAETNVSVDGMTRMDGAQAFLNVLKHRAIHNRSLGIKFMHVFGDFTVKVAGPEATASGFYTAYRYHSQQIAAPITSTGWRGTYDLCREGGTWKLLSFVTSRLWLEGESY